MFFKKPKELPYLKIDQNGLIDIKGDFNPETLADIFFIMRQEIFYHNMIALVEKKFGGTDFQKRFSDRIATQNIVTKEKPAVHPLESWKNINEN